MTPTAVGKFVETVGVPVTMAAGAGFLVWWLLKWMTGNLGAQIGEIKQEIKDETDEVQISHRWVVTGLTPNTEYTWWLGAYSSYTSAVVLRWGGDADLEYQPFIMKATALPEAVTDYAVYD